ncbi:MAG: hypothetical protein JJ953_04965 [Gracilimonas sp.]|uniref:DUF6364 family protein n=1 Tax=Gracilimonas TaxID=649462 RepID=UPI001B142B1A|nr:DUF6364 family protein [Gracilimonas sp.]MBO6585433.1 hypothetical protein [Gracilimonas sp.]MBO6616429.1 hypothetical protein [Gracilimonas sp.]
MKEKLTLSIEKSVKAKAKRIAGKSGKSVSGLFEDFIIELSKEDYWNPPKESATEQISKAVPNNKKVNSYDYKSLKGRALQSKMKRF